MGFWESLRFALVATRGLVCSPILIIAVIALAVGVRRLRNLKRRQEEGQEIDQTLIDRYKRRLIFLIAMSSPPILVIILLVLSFVFNFDYSESFIGKIVSSIIFSLCDFQYILVLFGLPIYGGFLLIKWVRESIRDIPEE